ncbi:hypothetical protein A9Q90_09315 [Gammaproteobacteria bacterium 54_18_T64]|nr:hypothetical protein A9Q90_09315 [Gammaproteobacteria bacterium 54_18_T64]
MISLRSSQRLAQRLLYCFTLLACLLPSLAQGQQQGGQLAALLTQSSAVSTPAQSKILLDQIYQALAQELASLTPRDFVGVADAYGKLVAGARERGGSRADFEYLLARGEGFFQRCRAKVRDLEQATGDREAALEKLYRSDLWHDINYALSAFNYWHAWGKLGLAHSYQGQSEQLSWLSQAEHGFQSSSVRILYPGIVYGSWLGMAYTAAARGDEDLAEQRFRRLVLALANDGENPARLQAETELTLLAIRKGELPSLPQMSEQPLTPTSARVYQDQAFMLLQRERDRHSGAIEAAVRLKRVIEQGHLNDVLLSRILAYRDEIAGHDIGLLSLYIDSEYAYAWQQYDTAVLKYQEFRQGGGLELGVNVRVLQYHYAVALLKIQLARDALQEVEQLQHQVDLPQPVAQALPKLKFLIAQALYQRRDNRVNRRRVLAEAKYFLRISPEDVDVGSAHLMIAQLSDDPKTVKRHLRAAKQDKKLKGSVALTQTQRAISAFNRTVVQAEIGAQRDAAKKVLTAMGELPRGKRKQTWYKAVSLQMRAVLGAEGGENFADVLTAIDKMYAAAQAKPGDKKYALDQRVRRVLFWTQLRALDQHQQGSGLAAFIAELASQASNAMAQKEVYQFLLAKEQRHNYAQLIALGDVFYPALVGQPQDQRQLRLLQIRAANALGENQRAYAIAQQLIADFPDSGNAWMAFAISAEQLGRWFEAERAWARITSGQVTGSARWREAMQRRSLALIGQFKEEDQGASKDIAALCKVLARTAAYRHLLNDVEQRALDEGVKAWDCQ